MCHVCFIFTKIEKAQFEQFLSDSGDSNLCSSRLHVNPEQNFFAMTRIHDDEGRSGRWEHVFF